MKNQISLKVKITKTHVITDEGRVKCVGVPLGIQYGRLMDHFHGDWATASKVQTLFNKQFSAEKRRKFWNPGHVIE